MPRNSPWIGSLAISITLHVLGLTHNLLRPNPTPPHARGNTLSIFVLPARNPAQADKALISTTRPTHTSPAPRPVHRKPSPKPIRPSRPQQPPAQSNHPAPESSVATTMAPMTAGLFGPITQQALGRGGWGQRRSPATQAPPPQAQQAQQAMVLRMTVESRLAAMSTVMRQSQLSPDCHIQIDPKAMIAQVSCQPPALQSAAWSSLQGLLRAGDFNPAEERWCLQWTAWATTTLPCSTDPAGAQPPAHEP